MLANAAGGGVVLLDSIQSGQLNGMSWSPDGQWVCYLRELAGKQDLAKVRATPGSVPEIVANAKPQTWIDSRPRWSPAGDWIAYPAADGIDLISPDGKSTRNLSSRKFLAYGFSKDGTQVYGVFQNTTGNGSQWQLYSVNVAGATHARAETPSRTAVTPAMMSGSRELSVSQSDASAGTRGDRLPTCMSSR